MTTAIRGDKTKGVNCVTTPYVPLRSKRPKKLQWGNFQCTFMLVPSRTLTNTHNGLIVSVAQEVSTKPVAFSSHAGHLYHIRTCEEAGGPASLLVSSSLALGDASCYTVNCAMERPA